jgi:SAM-dependent methyltransferase
LRDFYARVRTEDVQPGPEPTLDGLGERYHTFRPPILGYATVADYCDSADSLPFLTSLNGDMKDVQRPWVLKALIGAVPPGSRLLEIGAGDPHVADILGRLGYAVTIVDPYDGRDRGPSSFDAISKRYPDLSFVRGVFPEALGEGVEPFDCIYSISVLEHIPTDEVESVCLSIRRFTKPGGFTIHAIDHVLHGIGDREHLDRLRRIASSLGLEVRELDSRLELLEDDVETYFLSAEGHNRWRGSLPYDEFPMRRCVSIQVCLPLETVPG